MSEPHRFTSTRPSLTLFVALPIALSAFWSTGCGTLANGASYTGKRYPPVVTAEQVKESDTLPTGHERIGEVSASCTDTTGDVEWYDVMLSDILCSESKLGGSMRQKVAEVGGTVLVGRECDTDSNTETRKKKKDGKEQDVTVTVKRIACEGDVARPTPEPAQTQEPPATSPKEAPASPVASGEDDDDDSESTAPWRIRVRVTHAKDAARREPRPADSVEALDQQPDGTERIGDIVARCEQGCSRSAVFNGVREAGAQLGATAVIRITCVEEGEGWTCTGTAVAPPSPPQR